MSTAFVFPGQGAQIVGMGRDFFDAHPVCKETFDEADRILGRSISSIAFEGPSEELMQTLNAQSAMLTTCTAIARLLMKEGVHFTATAGLSLGEYAAMVASGALRFEEALPLVEDRARYMQEAVPAGLGGMVAIIGLDLEGVEAAVTKGSEAGDVSVANFNAPGQIVITGMNDGLQAASAAAKELGAKKCIPLAVSAPFHSTLLQPAANRLAERLSSVAFSTPQKRVYANVNAEAITSHEEIPARLAAQVTHSVLWQPIVERMIKDGITRFVEIGPGKTLTGFIKRIAKERGAHVELFNISTVADFTDHIDRLRKDAL